VSLVRDPVARNISAFFQEPNMIISESDNDFFVSSTIYDYRVNLKKQGMARLIEEFFDKFDHEAPLVFYDREIRDVFGIDIYSYEFPKAKGYKIYEGDEVDMLVIRLEDLDLVDHDAFKNFLDIEEFRPIRRNVGNEKKYARIYREMLESIIIPEWYCDWMYNSKFAKYFYSKEEIEVFKKKWRRHDRLVKMPHDLETYRTSKTNRL
jgi:hypothetical protein